MRALLRARVAVGISLVAGAGLVALVALAACEAQVGTYVYRGRKYDPEKQCLEATKSLDVVDSTQEPALCLAVCLVQNAYDGGRATYVSTTCPPYPYGFDTSGKDPSCAAALRAADQKSGCLPPPPDGGPDAAPDASLADASNDAASDAGADVGVDGSSTDASALDASDSDSGDAARD